MHEWALAEAVVTTAAKAAEEQHFTEISEITVSLGELQQIEREIFEFALQELIKQEKPALQKAKVVLEIERALFRCRVCGREWAFANAGLSDEEAEAIHFVPEVAHVYMRCPACASPDFEVIKGRGVWLASLKGVQ